MASRVDICNQALLSLGAEPISAIDEGSASSIACEYHYEISRDEVLSEWEWTFATKRAALAVLTNDTTEWTYKYQYPADCLKPIEIVMPSSVTLASPIAFRREGEALYCNVEQASLKYVYRLEDAHAYPAYFARALASKLAADIAMSMTRDPNIKQNAETLYARHLVAARATDGNSEQVQLNARVPDWLEARNDGPGLNLLVVWTG